MEGQKYNDIGVNTSIVNQSMNTSSLRLLGFPSYADCYSLIPCDI